MRSTLLAVTVVVIFFFSPGEAHSCKKIPGEIEVDRQYTVYVHPDLKFAMKITKIDNSKCWVIGDLVKNNKRLIIDTDRVIVISEEINKRSYK